MTTSQEIHGTSRIIIHPGKLAEFERLVAECVDIVRTEDPGTIEYDIFVNADGTEAFVHERYRDSDAGRAHMDNIAPMMEPLAAICDISGEVCGHPDPALRAALEAAGVTIYAPLTAAHREAER